MKTRMSLCFIKQNTVEAYNGVEVYLHAIFTTVRRRFAVNFKGRPLFPHIHNHRYALNMTKGLREPLDAQNKRKFYCTFRVPNRVRTDRSLIAINTEVLRLKINFAAVFLC